MSGLFSISIKIQLFVIAFILALPAVSIIIYSGFERRNEAFNEARTETQKLADNIAYEQQNLVNASQQLLSALAQMPEIKGHNTAKTHAILSDILKLNPQYLNIFIADQSGTMWASAIPLKTPFSISDRRYFRNALASGRFSSGEYIVGRMLSKPTISFGYPFRNQKGELAGVIAVNLDLEYFRKLLEQSKLPPRSGHLLVDHNGVILSGGINPTAYIGKQDIPKFFQRMQTGPNGDTFIGTGLDGAERIITYRKLYLSTEQTPYMYVRATITVKAAKSKADRVLFKNLALYTPFIFLAFLMAWLVAKRSIVDRVTSLQAASQRLAGGDLQIRVSDLVKGGELGSLGQSFDEMARSLSGRDREIRELNADLENRVIERTAQLEAANQELESFSYSVSHDLRAPLTRIIGFTSILQKECVSKCTGSSLHYVNRIMAASQKMNDVIDALLKLGRVGKNELMIAKVNLSSQVREIAETLKEHEPNRHVTFRIANGIEVAADPSLMKVVMENLLGNAWKYTSKTETAIIEFGTIEREGKRLYFVRDNGVGFDMADVNKLFAPFQRLHSREEFEGIGIGLVTVQRIITYHGGKIWPEGKPGEGATFYFTLA